jgi:DNA-binding MarR family transcriptional regulator
MADAVETLIWETRRLFRAAAAASDQALEPLDLTASDRALLEFLAREKGAISLAELARKRSVSRQHIHQSLARLKDPRLIEKTADPRDARSMLLRLTKEGRARWQQIRAVDRAILRRVGRQIDPAAVRAATRTLRRLREILQGATHD